MRRAAAVVAACAACAAGGVALAGGAADEPAARVFVNGSPALANGCFGLTAAGGRSVALDGEGYGERGPGRGETARFHLKPTGPGGYLLHDQAGLMPAPAEDAAVVRSSVAGGEAEWQIQPAEGGRFELVSTATASRLALARSSGRLVHRIAGMPFELRAVQGCTRFPEARVGARGRPFRGTLPNGSVSGFADIHMHVTANLRAGGRVISGLPFHSFGIPDALGHDDHNHGPGGSLDVTGNLLRDGQPAGTHDTHGWPSFTGWPVHDTFTHQQAYYVWIERAWMAGLRLLVAQAVEDEALCELQPLKSHSCDEMQTVALAVRQLRDLERYVDAQHGGPGRGWFRLVRTPAAARRVIERGKLAVVIGMETSSPLGCSEFLGEPQCTRDDVDSMLAELGRLGVTSVFLSHWIDNALGGVALQSGAQGDFIGVFQAMTTGHPFATEPCGAADEADGTCNAKGFTPLGRYLLRRMMERGMLIEADHLSQNARRAVFEMAERRGYPLVSSHTNTGGEWTPRQLDRLAGVGGISSATPETAVEWIDKILRLRRHARGGTVAFGSDTGGFASSPPPPAGGRPLRYPFTSYDGAVRFRRQRTGERTFDLNADGVAHYGLYADLIADAQRRPGGRRALRSLFGSAEAYLRMWERARRP